MNLRHIFVPYKKEPIISIQSWSVRWKSFSGSLRYPDIKEEIEFFINEGEANLFANSLREAFKFLRINENCNKVIITENK
jgi:hypothetical protein